MAFELSELVDPAHTALVTQECQKGVIGPQAALPQLSGASGEQLGGTQRPPRHSLASAASPVPGHDTPTQSRVSGIVTAVLPLTETSTSRVTTIRPPKRSDTWTRRVPSSTAHSPTRTPSM